MLIIWNTGAVAQVNLGLRSSVYNWSGPAGAAAVGTVLFLKSDLDGSVLTLDVG